MLVLLLLPYFILWWACESRHTRISKIRKWGYTWQKIANRYNCSVTTGFSQTGDEVLYQRAIEQMYFAVQENPANIEALLTRATLLADGDNLTACQDLERAISELSLSTENGLQGHFMPQIETLSAYLSCGG